jgi:indolepyruvate decarboxylase
MNVGEALLNALKEAGAKALFGIPGDYALPFFDVIEESRLLPLYTFSHEPAIGYAADAAARYGGGVGVAVVTYGAGALNMINAVACAWSERSPLVIISGAPGTAEFDQGLLLHHQIRRSGSQMRIFEELTCARTVLDDPAKAPKEIARVLRACRRHSRPVYIELPRNIPQAPCQPVQNFFQGEHDEDEDAARLCAEAIKRQLAKAKRPAILADVEVRRFGLEDSVIALAAKTGIPLATTFMGKGMFTGHKSVCMGTYLGMAGDAALRDSIEDSDCLLMMGVIASDTNLGMAGKKIDLTKAIRINEGCVLTGEEKFEGINLADLVKKLQSILPAKSSKYLSVNHAEETSPKENRLLRADDIAGIVNAQLKTSPKTPLAVDVGDCLFISMSIRDVPFLASGYYATMGFGVPAGLGVQAATGERPLIIVGDGGFQMTGWELLNCARSGLDPVVLVLNNGSWGMLKQFQPQAGYTSRGDISYAALAGTLGGDGYKATTTGELAEALQKAFRQRGKFQLVEALLPKGDISTTLKRYIAAMKSGMALQAVA